MRCTVLTALFFTLFTLFSSMAYAAPVASGCSEMRCIDATTRLSDSSSSSNDPITLMTNLLKDLIARLSYNNNTPGNYHGPTTTVVTSVQSSSTAALAPDSTYTTRPVPTIKWFTEIAIPSPTPSGV